MASALKPWLEEELHIALLQGRVWLEDKPIRRKKIPKFDPDKEWLGCYEDNGSCLEITERIDYRRNSNLQIIKEDPLTLTDGKTYVVCGPRCLHDLETRFGPPPLSLGDRFPIEQYTINYTSYGPPQDLLTVTNLQIGKPKARGCVDNFNQLRSIAECEKVYCVLQELRQVRNREDYGIFLPVVAQEEDEMTPRVDDGNGQFSPDTQMAYGTQIVHPARTHDDDNVTIPRCRDMSPMLAGNTRTSPFRKHQSGANSAQQAALLSLLNRSGYTTTASSVSPTSDSALPTTITKVKPSKEQTHTRLGTLDESQRPSSSTGQKPMHLGTTDSNTGKQRAPSYESRVEPHLGPNSPVNVPLSGDYEEPVLDDPEPEWLQGFHHSRVSAKIPSRQRSLLTKPESWHKPEPGHRFPDANIPIELLEEFKEHAEMSAEETSSERSSVPPEDDLPLIEEVNAELASSPVSWSSSPEPAKRPTGCGNGLPPDSSFETGNAGTDEHMVLEQPSSPPVVSPAAQAVNDSDDEMELDVPRGLGEDQSLDIGLSAPIHARVQVAETPYAKAKSKEPVGTTKLLASTQKQTSSVSSRDIASTPIVYGTYDSNSSTGGEAQKTDATIDPTTDDDVVMQDASAHVPHTPKSSDQISGYAVADATDRILLSRPDTVPRSAQLPPPLLSSSGEQAPIPAPAISDKQGTLARKDNLQAPTPFVARSKRKIDESPSKKHKRPSKRPVEIKQKGFLLDSQLPNVTPPKSMRNEHGDPESNGRYRDVQTLAGKRTSDMLNTLGEETRPGSNDGQQGLGFPQHASWTNKPRSTILPTHSPKLSPQQKPHEESNQASIQSMNHPANSSPSASLPTHTSPKIVTGSMASASFTPSTQNSTVGTIFEKFKVTYPEYNGDRKHFENLCKQMRELDLKDTMVPKWMWDDYLIRNRSDYRIYALQCMNSGEELKPYIRFYKDDIRDTLYKQGIIESRETLCKALEELGVQSSTATSPAEPDKKLAKDPPRRSLNPESKHKDKPVLGRSRQSLPSNLKQSRPSTSTPRTSINGSAFNVASTPRHLPSRVSTEPTGDPYRDYAFNVQRVTSLTGSTEVDPEKPSPANLDVRPVIKAKPRAHDVLKWSDEL